ncbi:MAG: 30S ribosomal protein S16 [Candidatus Eisenbacteria sp.]|nr:30S ribosomal protein S16 [Candidatus Eisenbacteria bacterium]
MVRIRLKRGGKTNRPCYRVVVMDARTRRDGRVIETVGFYDPLTTPSTIRISQDRVRSWIEKGAQLSDSVKSLMKKAESLPQEEAVAVQEPVPPLLGSEG